MGAFLLEELSEIVSSSHQQHRNDRIIHQGLVAGISVFYFNFFWGGLCIELVGC